MIVVVIAYAAVSDDGVICERPLAIVAVVLVVAATDTAAASATVLAC